MLISVRVISAAVEKEEEEDFACPLFVWDDLPNQQLPLLSATPKVGTSALSSEHWSPLFKVRVPTIEDVEDCRCFGVSLFSAPHWVIPTEHELS